MDQSKNHNLFDFKTAYNKCIFLLRRKDYSTLKMREYLQKKGFEKDIIDKVLERLVHLSFINDEAFCHRMCENLLSKKAYSINEIIFKLKNQGFEIDDIHHSLDKYRKENYEYETCLNLLRRKYPSLDEEMKEKAFTYLARKGFKYSDISNAYEDILYEENYR